MTSPLPPIPDDMEMAPRWRAWFRQLYAYLSGEAAAGGVIVPNTRAVNTTAPLSGGGTLSADRTLTLQTNGVSNTYLAQMAASSLKGNATGAVANAADLTGTQATALLDAFTAALKGLAPASGGGTANLLRADGTWTDTVTGKLVAGTYLKSASTTVAGLPSAATAGAGARHFVTDATVTTFASVVAGGGANKVPVVSDGTNWLIG